MAGMSRSGDDQGSEGVRFLARPEVEGATVLSVRGTRKRWSMVHDTFTVAAVTSGKSTFRCRREDGRIEPRTLMLIEPGDVHSTGAIAEPGDFHAFFMDAAFVKRTLGVGRAPTFRHVSALDPAAVEALSGLARTFHDPASDRLELTEGMTRMMGDVFGRHSLEANEAEALPDGDEAIERAMAFIEGVFEADPVAKALTIGRLAAEFERKPVALIKGFTKYVGVPPFQYLQRLRVEKARRLIAAGPRESEGLLNLSDVAMAVGFFDLPRMNKIFQRVLTVSPSTYARQIGCLHRWTARRRRQ
jgi:AraC-like DNA-binding protein